MGLSNWIRVEQPSPTGRAEIGARRIYILPTRYGLIYTALLFLMLLGSVNYGNNPAHLLTFLLGALGSNAMYMTWRNLRGLRLVCRGTAPLFAGQPVRFLIELGGDGNERPAIQLGFEDNEPVLLDVPPDQYNTSREIPLEDLPRGEHLPGRLTISTQYPLGLFRAWCQLACERPILVYPQPGQSWLPPGSEVGHSDGGMAGAGNDDFTGLRGYRPGDQASWIDWKSYARDRGLNTRLFDGQAALPLWINWDDAPGTDTEARLSALTRAVLDAEARGRHYGLKTPQGSVAPSNGQAHRHACLKHLALYGWPNA